MGKQATLASLPKGSWALVTGVVASGITRRRLMDLGLVPGTRVEMVRRSPVGDPIAYSVRGAVIALRRELASQVLIQYEEERQGTSILM